MSEPIRNKKTDLPVAPYVSPSNLSRCLDDPLTFAAVDSTPQNTPANNAPISSHAQEPGVSSIKEGSDPLALAQSVGPAFDIVGVEGFDPATAASLFARNPALVSMIQGKLGSLVGRSSGYIESLPAPVRRRVAGLKGIQKEHSKLESKFQEEVLELEKKYFAKFTPLYQKRATIVNGSVEPTDDEVEAGQEEGELVEAKEGDDEQKKTEDKHAAISGIPEFWLSAMKNQVSLSEMITERDEEALRHLTDIRMEYLDRPGFRLLFEFSENEHFTNSIISKTYYYKEESGYGGDFIYDHADGDKIDWKADKNLTLRMESKKQRNKSELPERCQMAEEKLNATRYEADSGRQGNRADRILFQFLLPAAAPGGRRRGSRA